jgi:hypothetical protein
MIFCQNQTQTHTIFRSIPVACMLFPPFNLYEEDTERKKITSVRASVKLEFILFLEACTKKGRFR